MKDDLFGGGMNRELAEVIFEGKYFELYEQGYDEHDWTLDRVKRKWVGRLLYRLRYGRIRYLKWKVYDILDSRMIWRRFIENDRYWYKR
jgi:hypothetical protein